MAMRSNIKSESELTDLERDVCWVFDYLDERKMPQQALIHEVEYPAAVNLLYKYCGHVVIKDFKKITGSEIKEEIK